MDKVFSVGTTGAATANSVAGLTPRCVSNDAGRGSGEVGTRFCVRILPPFAGSVAQLSGTRRIMLRWASDIEGPSSNTSLNVVKSNSSFEDAAKAAKGGMYSPDSALTDLRGEPVS